MDFTIRVAKTKALISSADLRLWFRICRLYKRWGGGINCMDIFSRCMITHNNTQIEYTYIKGLSYLSNVAGWDHIKVDMY